MHCIPTIHAQIRLPLHLHIHMYTELSLSVPTIVQIYVLPSGNLAQLWKMDHLVR